MKKSAKIDYACRAVVELALHWPSNAPMQINTIAERQDIPLNFLTHILINLKQLGLVESIRGKSGGYVLAKSPEEIKFSDIIVNLGGMGYINPDAEPEQGKNQVLNEVWHEIDDVVLKKMHSINFGDICDRIRRQNQTLMFDI